MLSASIWLAEFARWVAVEAIAWGLSYLWSLFMHLGLVGTMHLGMFSWAMLAFYPVLLGPWTCKALDWVGMHSRERWQRLR